MATEPLRLPPSPPRPPEPSAIDDPRLALGGFFRSFVHAWNGLMHALSQRNMKFHMVSALLVGLVGSGIRLDLAEKVTLIFCVMLIFFAEILNTALEALVDLHTEDFRSLARTTKDAAAGGVLILAMGTVVIFAALLVHNWDNILLSGDQITRQVAAGAPLALLTALMLVRRMRPRWVDHLLFAASLGLWALLWTWTVSSVFSALIGGLVFLAWRASSHIHAWKRLPEE